MNAETARRYIEAKRTKRQLEAALREVNETIENLEIGVLEQMGSDGITQLKLDGTTVYQKTVVRAEVNYNEGETTDEGYERTCDELVKVGLGRLVKRRFFPQSVTAWINDGGDRSVLEGIMRVTDIHQLGVRDL